MPHYRHDAALTGPDPYETTASLLAWGAIHTATPDTDLPPRTCRRLRARHPDARRHPESNPRLIEDEYNVTDAVVVGTFLNSLLEYSFKRSQHDNRAINKMIERAEADAAGTRPLKKDRFVKITDAVKGVDWNVVERARYLAGLKSYVTNIGTDTMDGSAVVAAYHELYQVERSFWMAKSDLAARPMFHRIRVSIDAYITIVFAALAVSREAQARTGVSIKKIVQML